MNPCFNELNPPLVPRSEWYSYHFPELVRIVNDNLLFAKLVSFIKKRTSLSEEKYVVRMYA